MTVGKYRKKPVVIEAMQLTHDTQHEVSAWSDGEVLNIGRDPLLSISTLEGVRAANHGDWIIKGVQGEFYPCKPDIFAATYEEVT